VSDEKLWDESPTSRQIKLAFFFVLWILWNQQQV